MTRILGYDVPAVPVDIGSTKIDPDRRQAHLDAVIANTSLADRPPPRAPRYAVDDPRGRAKDAADCLFDFVRQLVAMFKATPSELVFAMELACLNIYNAPDLGIDTEAFVRETRAAQSYHAAHVVPNPDRASTPATLQFRFDEAIAANRRLVQFALILRRERGLESDEWLYALELCASNLFGMPDFPLAVRDVGRMRERAAEHYARHVP